jgi:hypothetical protein
VRRTIVSGLLVLGLLGAGLGLSAVAAGSGAPPPRAHAAATCADYSNQAAAQKAKDTRDADHDGIYCESLPCPCSTAAGSGSGGSHHSTPEATTRRPRLGPSVTLGPVRRRTGCHVRGPLPDADCTPGATFKYVTKREVCTPGYSRLVRNVRQSTKDAVYRAYGIRHRFDGASGEVDHLVSLELGGSNSRANLFPEAAEPAPGSHEKDRLEDTLHAEVCDGRLTLRAARRLIARDWVAAYHARFG